MSTPRPPLAGDRRAMRRDLADTPWQNLPEMAACRAAERAGIEAGLRLVEVFHHHGARRARARPGRAREALARLTAATTAAAMRADIAGATR